MKTRFGMNIQNIEGRYVNSDAIPNGSTIICAGASKSLLFEQSMIQNGYDIIILDPSPIKEDRVRTLISENHAAKNRLFLVRRLFTPANEPNKRVFVLPNGSFTTCDKWLNADTTQTTTFQSVGIDSLFKLYGNISMLALDLNGEEFKVTKALHTIPQISVRFYIYKTSYGEELMQKRINRMRENGYRTLFINDQQTNGYIEYLFSLT
jgi:hypothetical protein